MLYGLNHSDVRVERRLRHCSMAVGRVMSRLSLNDTGTSLVRCSNFFFSIYRVIYILFFADLYNKHTYQANTMLYTLFIVHEGMYVPGNISGTIIIVVSRKV